MKRFIFLSVALSSAALTAVACDDSSGDSSGGGGGGQGGADSAMPVEVVIPAWEPDLDGDMLVSEIADDKLAPLCEDIVDYVDEADTLLACQIHCTGENTELESCNTDYVACLDDPAEARAASTVSASPAPLNCDAFTPEAVAECTRPIHELVDCITALGQSLQPSADAVSCDKAPDYDVDGANAEAALNQDVRNYISVCDPLLECEALVDLITGGGSGGGGGMGGTGG